MTGRPGDRTMEMSGGSTALYLARTSRVPFFMLIFIGLEAKGLLDFQGRRGITSVVRWNLRPVIFGIELSVSSTQSRKNYQYSTEGQKFHQTLAPLLVIILGKSLVFSRKILTSTGFHRCCAADA